MDTNKNAQQWHTSCTFPLIPIHVIFITNPSFQPSRLDMKTCQLSRSYQYHATEYKDNAILLKLKSFPIPYSKTKEIQVFSCGK